MATTYYADNYSIPPPSGPFGGVQAAPFVFTVKTALVDEDKIYLVQLAAGNSPGFNLLSIFVDIPDLDSGSNLVMELGDDDDPNRYMTTTLSGALGRAVDPCAVINSQAPSIPFAAGVSQAGCIKSSLPAKYDHQNNLIIRVETAPNTGTISVAITGWITYCQLGTSPFTAV